MITAEPSSPEQLAAALADAAAGRRSVLLEGAGSKRSMAGPALPAEVRITTRHLSRVLQYEPGDLTVSVEAGVPWAELTARLAEHGQMIPLDPPFKDSATAGGVVAANTCGPRRRLYGSARDAVIGMTFATLEGKLVQSGGMVVKNVAGLDMAKLMIGSFGTLAAIAVVNFKVTPKPEQTKTFLRSFGSAAEAVRARDSVLRSVLQPAAIDLLNPPAAERVDAHGWVLAMQAAGSAVTLERYGRELTGFETACGGQEDSLWLAIREFTPGWLREHPGGAVVRTPALLSEVGAVLEGAPGPAVARAGNGVVYTYFEGTDAVQLRGKSVVEHAPEAYRESATLWAEPGSDLPLMQRVKDLFDPHHLLNRGRLYGRI